MSKVLVTDTYLEDIADAIREKLGVQTTYRPGDMAVAIESISGGGYPEPTGTISITQNGVVNVKDYASANVNVQGGGGEDPFLLTDYIESNGTQYINTGYSVKDNTVFELIANAATSQPQYGTMFGTRQANYDYPSSQSCILAATWDSSAGNVNWGSNINRVSTLDKGNKTKYVIRKERYIAMLSNNVDDVIGVGSTGSTTSATTQPLFLFTLGINGADYGSVTHSNMKLYRFRIYEGDTLVHEFVPWTDGNSVVCLKDTVTGDIKYNAGTGVFVRGSDT